MWYYAALNLTPAQIENIASRLAVTEEDEALLLSEGEFEGFCHSKTADRCMGYADWIGYLPSCQRAAWISNGDPVWFDATGLDDAVEQVTSGAELIN